MHMVLKINIFPSIGRATPNGQIILAVEILSCKTCCLSYIKGIKIGGTEIKISHLADDTACFIDVSVQNMITVFYKLKNVLALKLTLIKLEPNPLDHTQHRSRFG